MRSSHIAASSLAAALPIATAAPEHCSEDFFKSILPENATLLFAESVAENCTFNVSPANIAYPKSPTNLPATCALQINVTTSATSAFSFGLFLPDTKTYNDRILGVGNGGFAGGVNWLDMAAGLHYGFASWSTDTGHNSTSGDLSWALNNEERRQDWGHRAIHGSAVMARQVAEAYYKAEAKYAYFSGCSTGGRQALREVQLHPETFDGVLAGAPAWWTDRLQTWSLWVGLLNLPTNSSSRIPPEAFPVIAKEVMAQCDWQDGLKDGIISDSAGCRFVPEALLCHSENDLRNQSAAECLTPHQLSTLKQIYSDYRGADNAFIFPGLELGSEEQWAFLMGAAKPSTYGSEFVQDFVLDDPSWDPTTAYNSTIPFTASARRPGNASATDFDLRPFHARGGKIIHHHGSADGLIPTGSSVYFHAQVQQTLQPHGVNPDDFYRFFVVPGMQHCAGTPADVGAPWYFAGPNQAANLGTSAYSVPGYQDAAHDELLALMAWVEEDKAPETLIATEWKGQDVKNGVRRQRPLCKWPEQARFLNEGSPDDAENWKCESIHGEHQPGYAQEEQVVGDSY